jgi:hypothetical protein
VSDGGAGSVRRCGSDVLFAVALALRTTYKSLGLSGTTARAIDARGNA